MLNNRTRPIKHQHGFLYNPPKTLQSYRLDNNRKFKPPTNLDSQIRLIPTKTSKTHQNDGPPYSFDAKVMIEIEYKNCRRKIHN